MAQRFALPVVDIFEDCFAYIFYVQRSEERILFAVSEVFTHSWQTTEYNGELNLRHNCTLSLSTTMARRLYLGSMKISSRQIIV